VKFLLKSIRAVGATLWRDTGYTKVWTDGDAALRSQLEEYRNQILVLITPTVDDADRRHVRALLNGYEVVMATNDDDARAAVAGLLTDAGADGPIAADTETEVREEHKGPIPVAINLDGTLAKKQPKTGAAGAALDSTRARVRLLQAYAGGNTIVLFDMRTVTWETVAPLFERELVMHNATFDIRMIIASGGPEPQARVYDTMTAMRLLFGFDQDWPVGLGRAAEILLDIVVPEDLGAADWSGIITPDMRDYAAADPLVTFQLRQAQRQELDDTDECSQSITDECLVATARMELAGLPHDADAHNEFIHAVMGRLTAAQDALATATDGDLQGIPTDNMVRAHIAASLSDDAIAAWPLTKKSTPERPVLAVNKVALAQDAAAGVPGIPELLQVRQWAKAASTYGQPLLDQVSHDGRLRARYLVAGARTGRYSCREPNLQTLPKRNKEELIATFRRIVRAPEGHVIVAADYSQIELRIMAEISGDETMLAAFDEGRDVHLDMAMALAGGDWDSLDAAARKRARSLAKASNFGLIYGSGAAAFARSATASGTPLTMEEADDIITTWKETYPDIAIWQDAQTRGSRASGYVQTAAGRRWYFEWRAKDWDDSALDDLEEWQLEDAVRGYERNFALNMPIQGSAAEVMQLAIAHADRALRDHAARIVGCVHDELVLEVADDPMSVLSVEGILKTEMTRAWLDLFPEAPWRGLVDVGWGPTWADAH
jgi:DNA polymerase-1